MSALFDKQKRNRMTTGIQGEKRTKPRNWITNFWRGFFVYLSLQVVGYLPRPAAGARATVGPLHGLWARGSGSRLVPGTVSITWSRSWTHQGSLKFFFIYFTLEITFCEENMSNLNWIYFFHLWLSLMDVPRTLTQWPPAVLDVSDTERSGFLARQPDRPQRPEAAKCAGHGGWTGQAGGFRFGPYLRRSHGSHFGGEWQ